MNSQWNGNMWMFVVAAQFDKQKLEVRLMLKVVVIDENDI